VPVEIVFDQTIGHLFVTRVAVNIITPEIIGSWNMEWRCSDQGDSGAGATAIAGRSKAAVGGKSVPDKSASSIRTFNLPLTKLATTTRRSPRRTRKSRRSC